MPKSIYLTDDQWSQVADHAVACGFFVGRGTKSELAKFVVRSAEWAQKNGFTSDTATAKCDGCSNIQSCI